VVSPAPTTPIAAPADGGDCTGQHPDTSGTPTRRGRPRLTHRKPQSPNEPRIVARAAQRYVAVTERVAPDQHGDAIDHGFAEVFGWLAVREGVSAAGAR
jgi:hypothetical protein